MSIERRAVSIRNTGSQVAESSWIRSELEAARQKTEVALAIAGGVFTVVPDLADRAIVVDDLVTQWRRLSPVERATFQCDGSSWSALAQFAWSKISEVDEGTLPDDAPPSQTSDAESERQVIWNHYVESLRVRAASTRSRID